MAVREAAPEPGEPTIQGAILMAESMFEEARSKAAKQTWRAVVIGAAIPFAMLAAAPAVSAAETEAVESTVQSEQLPPVPGAAPDPTALLDLQQCLTDLQAALSAGAPAPAPAAPGEQVPTQPGGDAPAAPDIGALTKTCQDILATVTGTAPTAPDPASPDPNLPVGP
ncbi:MAG TPA: hypothetical protein VHG10_12565 [Glycomyces sp.]|nr:hypothetical protein [Glycomyces sp.]